MIEGITIINMKALTIKEWSEKTASFHGLIIAGQTRARIKNGFFLILFVDACFARFFSASMVQKIRGGSETRSSLIFTPLKGGDKKGITSECSVFFPT